MTPQKETEDLYLTGSSANEARPLGFEITRNGPEGFLSDDVRTLFGRYETLKGDVLTASGSIT